MAAKKGSDEHRERISRGVRRAWERRRTREGFRPVHVDRWLWDGAVDRALVPILQTRAAQVEDIIADLGGPSEVTAMQRALIDGWLKAAVADDALDGQARRGARPGIIPWIAQADGVLDRLLDSLDGRHECVVAAALVAPGHEAPQLDLRPQHGLLHHRAAAVASEAGSVHVVDGLVRRELPANQQVRIRCCVGDDARSHERIDGALVHES